MLDCNRQGGKWVGAIPFGVAGPSSCGKGRFWRLRVGRRPAGAEVRRSSVPSSARLRPCAFTELSRIRALHEAMGSQPAKIQMRLFWRATCAGISSPRIRTPRRKGAGPHSVYLARPTFPGPRGRTCRAGTAWRWASPRCSARWDTEGCFQLGSPIFCRCEGQSPPPATLPCNH